MVPCAALLVTGISQMPALAATPQAPATGNAVHRDIAAATEGTPGPVRLAQPGAVLPTGWEHSADEAVTVVGDETGLHVLAASEASGYTWRSVATVGSPAVQTDLWIGQACVTGSGRYAVVVYAPEQVTNMAGAQGALARAAIVDLRTGAVRELGGGFSVAYFDPGCGTGTQAVLTSGGWGVDTSTAPASTDLVVVNAATGSMSSAVRVPGQVTSAVPFAGQIAAAGGAGVEEITPTGKTRLLARAPATPYELTPDASGGLGYQTAAGNQVRLWRLAGGHARQVASAARGSVELRQTGGRVWLVGPDASRVRGLPRQWHAVNAPVTAQPSTTGTLVVVAAESVAPAKGQRSGPDSARPVAISAQLLGGSRRSESFEVPTTPARELPVPASPAPAVSHARAVSPATTESPETAGSGTTPVSADRTCAIPLDDPQAQAYQPNFPQVEWAADQAVQGTLTDTRPAGLYGSSLPSYTPQGMFPLPSVDGGGSLPAQVLLGVLTAESNLQQASMHDIQGQASNPLTSFNWYGNWINGETTNTGLVNWGNSDCGYGIAQITSGMCLSLGQNNDRQCEYQASLPNDQQLAIAVDYQANIAKGAQLLTDYWNELWNDGIKPDGDTQTHGVSSSANYIDNWYMAVWAYNSGLEPGTSALGNTTGCTPGPSCTDGNGDWGLGFADNPINPAYPPDRPTFPGSSPSGYPGPGGASYSVNWDMSHPQYWPYQEKVLAWAYDAIRLWDYSKGENVQAFAYAHGTYTPPPYNEFCTSADNCSDSGINYTQATGPDACQLTGDYVDHCWWHVEPNSETWPITAPTITCSDCGTSVLTYSAGAADPGPEPIAAQFQQTCTESPLPSSAVIVGDGGQAALGCPGQNWTAAGSMTWNFAADPNGNYSSKIDFDQIGAGFGGHFWFGYTQPNNGASVSSITPASGYADKVITGTWTPPSSVTGWTTIEAAIPSVGDGADDANYQVDPGGGLPTRNVQINQAATNGTNTWVDLGDFHLASGAKVSLSNVTWGGTGVDIAWDAMAFVPTSDPRVNYVAMGDSYSSGEGVSPYYPDSNTSSDQCHRSENAYPTMVTLPGQTTPITQSSGDTFSFIACSGAETTGVTAAAVNGVTALQPAYAANTQELAYDQAGNTDWGYVQGTAPWSKSPMAEPLQDQQNQLSPQTGLVTVSSGGNDARFTDVLTGCLLTKSDCTDPNYYLTRNSNDVVDPMPLISFEQTVIQYLRAHLVQTYLDINMLAPSAEIIVVGYPLLFPNGTTTSCTVGTVAGVPVPYTLNAGDQNWLDSMGIELNKVIASAVSSVQADGVDIHFVDPTTEFTGHEVCSSSPWINGLQAFVLDGFSLNLVSPGSFHPNLAGQQEYAVLANKCLDGTISC
jgi:hypothetical protein